MRFAWTLLLIAIVLGSFAIAIAWRGYGYTPVAVQTGSMTPTYPVHSLLFVKDVPVKDVHKGDVISFDPPGRVPRTTHRVVERYTHAGRLYFRTKGDANPVADDWRTPQTRDVKGGDALYLRGISYSTTTAPRTEFAIPHLGWLAAIGSVPHLRMILLLVPFVVIALQLLRWIWRSGDSEEDASTAVLGASAPTSEVTDAA